MKDSLRANTRTTSLAIFVFLAISLFVLPGQTERAQTTRVSAKVLHAIGDGLPPYWWSPDNKTLAFQNTNILLYDAASGQLRTEIKYESARVGAAIYFSADSNEIIVQSDRLRVHNVSDGKLVRTFAEGTFEINTSGEPTGGYTSNDESGSASSQILEGLVVPSTSARPMSPDGKLILVGANAGNAQVYDLSTGTLKFTFQPFIPSGKKKLNGYNYARGEFSADGRFIATANGTRTPRLWNAATGELIANLGPQTDDVYQATFSVDSKFVLTPCYDGIVRIWETATGKLLHVIGSKADRNYFAAWNPVNNSFVAKSKRGEINLWDAATGQLICKLDRSATKEKFDENGTFAYSPDGKILVTQARNENTLRSMLAGSKGKPRLIAHLWDPATGSLLTSLRDNTPRDAYAYQFDKYFWTPNSNFLVIAGASVRIWNTRGELMQELDGNAALGASLSPNGKLLIIRGDKYETLSGTLIAASKMLIGKLPKYKSQPIYVWQIEE